MPCTRKSTHTWPEYGAETPSLEYFEPGNLYIHPAIINALRRMGGLPHSITIEELNRHPDKSVSENLKEQLSVS